MADIAQDFLSAYGKSCPFTDVAGLKTFMVQGKPFLQHLQDIIKNSTEYVTHAQLRKKAEDILKPELGRCLLRDSLSQQALELGVKLNSSTLYQVLDSIKIAAENRHDLINLKDVTSPDKARAMLAQASNLGEILTYYDKLPDLKTALLSFLEQKANAMGLKHLTLESRKKVAQAIYDAINAYSKKTAALDCQN